MNESRYNFLLEEYKQLRQEITLFMQRMDSAERNAILASGAIWAWLASNVEHVHYPYIVWVPMFITFMFSLKVLALRHGMYRLGLYIKEVEKTLELPNDLGWELNNGMVKSGSPFRIGLWPLFFWCSVISANLIAALLYPKIITGHI